MRTSLFSRVLASQLSLTLLMGPLAPTLARAQDAATPDAGATDGGGDGNSGTGGEQAYEARSIVDKCITIYNTVVKTYQGYEQKKTDATQEAARKQLVSDIFGYSQRLSEPRQELQTILSVLSTRLGQARQMKSQGNVSLGTGTKGLNSAMTPGEDGNFSAENLETVNEADKQAIASTQQFASCQEGAAKVANALVALIPNIDFCLLNTNETQPFQVVKSIQFVETDDPGKKVSGYVRVSPAHHFSALRQNANDLLTNAQFTAQDCGKSRTEAGDFKNRTGKAKESMAKSVLPLAGLGGLAGLAGLAGKKKKNNTPTPSPAAAPSPSPSASPAPTGQNSCATGETFKDGACKKNEDSPGVKDNPSGGTADSQAVSSADTSSSSSTLSGINGETTSSSIVASNSSANTTVTGSASAVNERALVKTETKGGDNADWTFKDPPADSGSSGAKFDAAGNPTLAPLNARALTGDQNAAKDPAGSHNYLSVKGGVDCPNLANQSKTIQNRYKSFCERQLRVQSDPLLSSAAAKKAPAPKKK